MERGGVTQALGGCGALQLRCVQLVGSARPSVFGR
jgi:hypothetical protein